MGKKLSSRLIAAILTAVLALGATVVPALAATNSQSTKGGGQALEIAPPIINLKANPGQTIKTKIQLRDVSGTDLIVSNEINDFVAGGEGGAPKILLNGSSNDPYSMKNWVQPLSQLTLKPEQIQTLNVTINVPKNASPGGHYAVIRFTGTPPKLKGQGVSLSASLGSLVLLTVSGNIQEHLSISDFAVGKQGDKGFNPGSFFKNIPLTFVEKIKNTGNLQEEPSGIVTVTDMFGHKVAAFEVNQPPHNVLPSSTREFTQQLDKAVAGNSHFFGRYTADVSLTYGQKDQTITAHLSFWIIPWILILIIIAALIVLFFIFRHLMRRYKRRIISQAQNQQAEPSKKPKSDKKSKS